MRQRPVAGPVMHRSSLLLLAIGGVALLWVLGWFIRLERRNERHSIFLVFVSVYLAEAILASHSAGVAVGLLRPQIAGQDFRLPDVVIALVVAARFFGPSKGGRIPSGVLPLCAFGAWYATAVVIGLLNQLPTSEVLFQGKAIFYVLGAVVAAAGADTRRLADQLAAPAVVLAAVVALATVLGFVGRSVDLLTPVQRFDHLGVLSNDTASALVVIGGLVLLVEAVRPRRRLVVGVAGIGLLLAPLAGDHRASYLVLAVVLGGVVLAVLGRTWTRRSTIGRAALMLSMSGVLVFGMAAAALTPFADVVVARLDTAFEGDATVRSAESRVELARRAVDRIAEHPIVGWGAGMQVIRTGEYVDDDFASAHNLMLDLAMRSGMIGLLLFLVALVSTERIGVQRWRRDEDNRTAAVCLAATLGVAAVVTKAMVEPALDKYRLSMMVGLCVGLILFADRRPAASTSPERAARPPLIRPLPSLLADVTAGEP